jgi:hypothetical protein
VGAGGGVLARTIKMTNKITKMTITAMIGQRRRRRRLLWP